MHPEEIKNRKSYDTKIKYLARKGLLPECYKRQIHRSLICKWKQEPVEKYVGYELNQNIEQLYDVMKLVGEDERLQRTLRSFIRIQKTLRDIIGKGREYTDKLKEHKVQVVNAIKRAGETLTVEKAARLMGIGQSTYRAWAMETYFKCNNSLLKLCNNAYPQQLTYKEIKKMYRLLSDSKHITWPIKSVAYFAIKQNILKAHPNTWYKYARLLEVNRIRIKKKKRAYPEGIRAAKPDQIWHADVTELKMYDGQIAYIYLVIDNFSRFILSWRISYKLCATTRLDTFKEAMFRAKQKGKKKIKTHLIVDGGSENNNKTVNAYIQEYATTIDKQVALKDILKSNAMAEYTNRVLKYEYLFTKQISNLKHLGQILFHSVFDFNCVRPHGALLGLTPAEAYIGKTVDVYKEKLLMKEAAFTRLTWNRTHNCNGCPFGCN